MSLHPSAAIETAPSQLQPAYGRRYTSETFDRNTGEIVSLDLGVFMTLSEFTSLMGVGMKTGRLILEEIGLIQIEDGRYRLKPEHEKAGLGKRLRTRTSRYPFDVLSPEGQAYARHRWAETEDALRRKRNGSPKIRQASQAFRAFLTRRTGDFTTQMAVCWFMDHYPELSTREIAMVLNVSEAIVFKWSAKRTADHKRLTPRQTALI